MSFKLKTKVAFLSAEVAPFSKVGGLADVAGSLPKFLSSRKLEIIVLSPLYSFIDKKKYKLKFLGNLSWELLPKKKINLKIYQTFLPGSKTKICFLEHKIFGKEVYGQGDASLSKFAFFSLASLKALEFLCFKPDILHLNDWHTALIPEFKRNLKFFNYSRSLLTIHNLSAQGQEKSGSGNYLLSGLLQANHLNTVSPSYAKEILTPEFACGLQKALGLRKDRLVGILNGLDLELFNPKTDKNLKYKYGPDNFFNGKNKNKLFLQKELSLPQDEQAPLLAFIARFSWQKGLDLFSPKFFKGIIGKYPKVQFVFLGQGEKKLELAFRKIVGSYKKNVRVLNIFDLSLASRLYAASDFFLVPSRFEPCGLTQMIAMRYASLPIVRLTGGLKDTVSPKEGWGFKPYSSKALEKAVLEALKTYYLRPKDLENKRKNALKKDFSWNKSANEYFKLYQKMIKLD